MQLYRDKEIVIELPDDKDNYEEILRKFYKENIASDEDENDKDINFLENKLPVKYLSEKYGLKDIFFKTEHKAEKNTEIDDKLKNEEQNGYEDLNTLLKEFQNNGRSLYIGLNNTNYSAIIGKIIVDYVSEFLLTHDITNHPMVLFIDEVHRYALEKDNQGEFNSPLIALSREGRKKWSIFISSYSKPKRCTSNCVKPNGNYVNS